MDSTLSTSICLTISNAKIILQFRNFDDSFAVFFSLRLDTFYSQDYLFFFFRETQKRLRWREQLRQGIQLVGREHRHFRQE